MTSGKAIASYILASMSGICFITGLVLLTGGAKKHG